MPQRPKITCEMTTGERDALVEYVGTLEAKYDDLLTSMERLRLSSHCDDCNLRTDSLIVKGDHHGGWKVVCRDRDACNRRAPG